MSVLADRIEKFILSKFMEEDNSVTIQRGIVAAELQCAPSQITYVLGTRFSTDRGYQVISRRGMGGYISITRIPVQQFAQSRKEAQWNEIQQVLGSMVQQQRVTNREGALLQEAFSLLMDFVDDEQRDEAVKRLYQRILQVTKEG